MEVSALTLAFIGDAVYSLKVREYLCSFPDRPLALLTKETIKYVSAKAQAKLMQAMLDAELLTEKEVDFYRRGRNSKSHTSAKNADILTYRISTGFEALMGYLYLTKQIERMEELIQWCIRKTGGES